MGQTQDMLGRKSLSASWEHFGVALEVLEVVHWTVRHLHHSLDC